jgi:hypothetical protein
MRLLRAGQVNRRSGPRPGKLNGVDPQAYLTDVLTRLVNLRPSARIDELMPWAGACDDSGGGLAV